MAKKKSKALKELRRERNRVFARFPLLFILLGTFGVVCTYYGLQHILEKITILAEQPYITLGVGIIILLFTGTLYKKLG